MKRETLIPAFLALTAHALLALIPLNFMARGISPSHNFLPLRISIVRGEPEPSAPSPRPTHRPASPVARQKPVLTTEKVISEKTSPQKKASHERLMPDPHTPKKSARRTPAPIEKKAAVSRAETGKSVIHEDKRPEPKKEVSTKPKSSPVIRSAEIKDRKPSAEQSHRAPDTGPQAQPTAQEATEGIHKAGEPGQTAALPPQQEDETAGRIQTLAIPRYELNTPPKYPRIARLRGQEGTTLLRVMVLPDGTVGDTALAESSGHNILDEAALNALKSWRFSPATEDGKPVAMWVRVPVTFRLK